MNRFGIFLLISIPILLILYVLIFPAIGYTPSYFGAAMTGIAVGIISELILQAVID